MKRIFYVLTILLIGCSGGSSDNSNNEDNTPQEATEIEAMLSTLWETSAMDPSQERLDIFETIQGYADNLSASYFVNTYLSAADYTAGILEGNSPMLEIYRKSYDKVLSELQSIELAEDEVAVWMLYNMGYIIKTPTGTFGMDLMHRYADQFEPYLDFMTVSHNHQDHYSTPLIEAMAKVGKPVLSNYLSNNSYTSTEAQELTIGDFKIRSNIVNHNNSALLNFVTVYKIEYGDFSLLHCGDSNYNLSQFDNVLGDVDLLIPRYSPEPHPLAENNIIGTTADMVNPTYLFMSHILELTHEDVSDSRWTLQLGLERTAAMNCDKSCMPFWGELFIFKNGNL